MYLQAGNFEDVLVEENDAIQNETIAPRKSRHLFNEHDKWKAQQKKRKCNEYSSMRYWQQVSHCSIL